MLQAAQTNLQLYNQLIRAGYTAGDLQIVRNAYDLAVQCFPGRYRAAGKPFVAHLIGTASILAADQPPLEITVAGLLHGVYLQGEFGDGTRGPSAANRARVRDAVGSQIEDYVMSYSERRWTAQSLRDAQQTFPSLTDSQRVSLTIRLADILEEFVDGGVCFSRKLKLNVPPTDLHETLKAAAGIAERMGFPAMARGFHSALTGSSQPRVPDCLRTAQTKSITITAPNAGHARGHRPRALTWLRGLVRTASTSAAQ